MAQAIDNLRDAFPEQIDDDGDTPPGQIITPECPIEPRLLCGEGSVDGELDPDGKETLEAHTTHAGSYVVAVTFDEFSRDNGWRMFPRPALEDELGDEFNGTVVEDIVGRLKRDTRYYLQLHNGTDQRNGYAAYLVRVSDGSIIEPVMLPIGEAFDATVGKDSSAKNYFAYYQIQPQVGGRFEISASGYPCGAGSGGMKLELYTADAPEDAFRPGGNKEKLATSDADDPCLVKVAAQLSSEDPAYLRVLNQGKFQLDSAAGVKFELRVRAQ